MCADGDRNATKQQGGGKFPAQEKPSSQKRGGDGERQRKKPIGGFVIKGSVLTRSKYSTISGTESVSASTRTLCTMLTVARSLFVSAPRLMM